MSSTTKLTNALLKETLTDAMVERGVVTNLEDCKTPGLYILRESDAVSSSPPDIPGWNIGALEVFRRNSSTYYHRITTTAGVMVYRIWSAGKWGPWQKVLTETV